MSRSVTIQYLLASRLAVMSLPELLPASYTHWPPIKGGVPVSATIDSSPCVSTSSQSDCTRVMLLSPKSSMINGCNLPTNGFACSVLVSLSGFRNPLMSPTIARPQNHDSTVVK